MNTTLTKYPDAGQRKFGLELEFVGSTPRRVADAIADAGVECFYEGYHHTTRSYWKIVTDSSLDSRYSGEIVSPPMQGKDGFEQLDKVIKALDTIEGIGVNVRCGLHVHIDVNDLTTKQIINVYERYCDYESQIDLIMPRSRRDNNSRWCNKLSKSTRLRQCKTKGALANVRGRYHKINMQSLTNYGTLEFRQHSGTLNFEKIANWVSFLQAFVEKSSKLANTTLKGKPSKNRPYALIRNAIENAGHEMFYSGGGVWTINTVDGTLQLSNNKLNTFYNGPRESDLDKAAFAYFARESGLWAHYPQPNWNTPQVEQVEVETDDGWLDGVEPQVQKFYKERELDLN